MVRILEQRIDESKAGVDRLDYPALPISFPTPSIRPARRIAATQVRCHSTGSLVTAKGVLLPSAPIDNPRRANPDRAYWLKRPDHKLDDKVKLTTHGCIIVCVVLRRGCKDGGSWRWETTDQLVAVKVSSLKRILGSASDEARASNRRRRAQQHAAAKSSPPPPPTDLASSDPLKEAAALEFLGNYHPSVLGCLDVLCDADNLYTVMPWCESGDLYEQLIAANHRSCQSSGPRPGCLSEDQARAWFRQLLSGLSHLQNKGVCHRSLSLENLLLDSDGNLKIIDFGMALRVPYTDTKNFNCISDVSEGSVRRLIVREQHQRGGNLTYLAPEVLAGLDFDGFAVDLWSAAVVLFVWLVGAAPFKIADPSDFRYSRISSGNLAEILRGLDIALSADACDLLQRMLHDDPAKRLSLKQIQEHRWMKGCVHTTAPSTGGATTVKTYTSRAAIPPRSPLRNSAHPTIATR
jgi:serine/threonine protein kinase